MFRTEWNKSLRAPISLALWVFCSVVSCTPIDGSDPYALWENHDDIEGRFHFHFLRPPWEPVSRPSSVKQVFVVDPEDEEPLDSSWTDGDGPGARLLFEVDAFSTADKETFIAGDIEEWKAAGIESESQQPFLSAAGDQGLWTGARGSDWRMVAIYHDLKNGGTVVMRVAGKLASVETDDVMLLLKSLEPRPSEDD